MIVLRASSSLPKRLISCPSHLHPPVDNFALFRALPTTNQSLSAINVHALKTRAYNAPVPPRIHQEAFWRGGAGAGGKGAT